MSVNKAILVGRLGVDPELRNTGTGTSVVNIRMATTDRRKEGDQWVDHTEWHNVTVWGRTAENVAKFCSKGKEIYVEGKIQTRKYTDKSGVDRYSTEIVADNVRFLGSRNENAPVVQAQNTAYAKNDEHIPF
jgi:single-strand DNA-binding protein|tara:strand:+ start:2106 stop:2501 length:396 start_codon:yes stop_codon:yes gene_type:complete